MRAAGVLAGGTFIGQGLTLLASPLLGRLYRVEDFATLGVFSSIVGVTVCVVSLGYEKAVPVSRDEEEAANTLAVTLASATVVGLVAALVLVLFGGPLAKLFNVPDLLPYRSLLVASLIGVGLYQGLNYWAIRVQAYTAIARTKISQGVGQVTTQVGIGIVVPGPLGLLLGDVISRVAGVIGLFTASGTAIRVTSFAGMRRAALRYREFPLFGAPAALLNAAIWLLPTLVISALFGQTITGWYSFGQRVAYAPLTVIGVAVSQALLGRAAVLVREDPAGLKRLLRSASRKLLLMFGVPVILLTVFGAPFFTLIFGVKWHEAGLYVQICGPSMLVVSVVGPIFPILSLLERQRSLLLAQAFGFALIVGGLFLVRAFGLGPRAAIASLGLSWSLLYIGLYALTMRAVNLRIAAVEEGARGTPDGSGRLGLLC